MTLAIPHHRLSTGGWRPVDLETLPCPRALLVRRECGCNMPTRKVFNWLEKGMTNSAIVRFALALSCSSKRAHFPLLLFLFLLQGMDFQDIFIAAPLVALKVTAVRWWHTLAICFTAYNKSIATSSSATCRRQSYSSHRGPSLIGN